MNSDWSFSKPGNIYGQIVEKLEKKIVSGEFSPGDRLPSVRALAEDAKVNPNTMMRALADLENKNLLYTVRGNGKYVTNDAETIRKVKEELAYNMLKEFVSNMYELGLDNEDIKAAYNKNMKNGGV